MKNYTLCVLFSFILVAPLPFAQTNTSTNSASTQTSPIPEEARKHFVMGTTLFKEAKTVADFSQAVSEFKQAADLAPQWPDARYNLALAKEAAGDYSGAMAELRLYQKFKLSDTEARTVQDKIYALEAKAGLAAKKQAEEQRTSAADEQKKREYQDKIGFLAGEWNAKKTIKCNCPLNGQTQQYQIVITITDNNISIGKRVAGRMEGEDYTSIKWVVKGGGGADTPHSDCAIDVTVDKLAHQINWKEPSSSMDGSGQFSTWDWGMYADIRLTK